MAPSHEELNLADLSSVFKYFKENDIDGIVHAANAYNISDDLNMFFNLFDRNIPMIYFGSGAEFEDRYYTLEKRIMNKFASSSDHCVNLRLYGVFGEHEPMSGFIPKCMIYKKAGLTIDIARDKKFSWVYVKDLCKIVGEVLKTNNARWCYDIANSNSVHLSELADMIGVKYRVLGKGRDYMARDRYFFRYTSLDAALKDYSMLL